MKRYGNFETFKRSNDDAIDSFDSISMSDIDADLKQNIIPKDNLSQNDSKDSFDDGFDLLDNIFSKDQKSK